MRGTRAKALRTADRPNPGRKYSGMNKDLVNDSPDRLTRAMRRSGFFTKLMGRTNGKTVTDGRA